MYKFLVVEMEGYPRKRRSPSNNITYDNDVWELYNLNDNVNERIDLAKKNPERLKELKALFVVQSNIYWLYPFVGWEDV